ncbi:MAG: hypothetical protein ABIG11_05020 [bacterium]
MNEIKIQKPAQLPQEQLNNESGVSHLVQVLFWGMLITAFTAAWILPILLKMPERNVQRWIMTAMIPLLAAFIWKLRR